MFGSGPADSSGVAATHDSPDNILFESISTQTGKLFVVDLKKLADSAAPVISTLDENGQPTTSAPYYLQELEANSFVSQPVTIDYDLDFNADIIYFGTVKRRRNQRLGRQNAPAPP